MEPFFTQVKTYKKRIIRHRPFLLLGNVIDGRILSGTLFKYNNLKELKRSLPKDLITIQAEGEWYFELYQVPKDYKIYYRRARYQYPERGTKIFFYDYHSPRIKSVEFKKNKLITTGIDNFTYKNIYPSVVDVEFNLVELEYEK